MLGSSKWLGNRILIPKIRVQFLYRVPDKFSYGKINWSRKAVNKRVFSCERSATLHPETEYKYVSGARANLGEA